MDSIVVAIHDQCLGRLCNSVDSQRKFGEIHQQYFDWALLLVVIRGHSFDGLYYSGDSLLNLEELTKNWKYAPLH